MGRLVLSTMVGSLEYSPRLSPLRASSANLESGLSLHQQILAYKYLLSSPLSLCTCFLRGNRKFGSGLPCFFQKVGFPEFDEFYRTHNFGNPQTKNLMTNQICLTCVLPLTGKQQKFCCRFCKTAHTNYKHQNYVSQQRRGADRRATLISLKGGKCVLCGYCKNQTALCFHHTDPQIKLFQIDIRRCSNCSWEKLLAEANKCQLLCLNCHAEIHNPDFAT